MTGPVAEETGRRPDADRGRSWLSRSLLGFGLASLLCPVGTGLLSRVR